MRQRNDRETKDNVTRRRVLELGAISAPLMVAGCVGDDDPAVDDGVADDPAIDDDDDPDEVVYRPFASHPPTDTQFNPYNPTNSIVQGTLVHWAPLMQYHVGTNQWIPMVASDWHMDGTTAVIEVADEFTWHNGDPVTAEDVETRLKLRYYMNDPIAGFLDAPPVAGNDEVELTLETEVQEDIFWPQTTGNNEYDMEDTPASIYGDFIERFDDAESDDEIEEVQADLLSFAPQEPGEEVLGNGPFEFIEAVESAQIFERHDDYPVEYVREQVDATIGYDFNEWPDEIRIDRFEFVDVGDLWAAYRSAELDGGADNAPAEVYAEYPDDFHQVGVPRDEMWGLTFQYDDENFGRQNVRKAFAHLIDRSPPLSDNMFPLGDDVLYESGMTTGMTEEWVSDDVLDSLTDYIGENTDEAAALLEEDGYTREDDMWYTPDDELFEFELRMPNYDDIVPGFQLVVSLIEDFGIQVDFNAMDISTFFGDIEPTGDFTVIASSLGNQPHPLMSYQKNLLDQSAATNYDLTPEIPPVGEPDGEAEQVDLEELMVELGTTGEEDRAQEIIDTLAWAHNQDIPYVACAEKAHQYLVTYADWEMPETVHEGVDGHDPLAMTHTPWHFPVHVAAVRPRNT